MEDDKSRTAAQGHSSWITRPILIAGLLGGLLGGVTSFAASRLIKPAKPEPPPSAEAQAATDAREVGDAFVAKLRAGKTDEFAQGVKQGMATLTEAGFVAFKQDLVNSRIVFTKDFGPPGDFELLRETMLSPSLVRLVYLEKFERGGLLWVFVLYKGVDRWYVSNVNFEHKLAVAFGGLS